MSATLPCPVCEHDHPSTINCPEMCGCAGIAGSMRSSAASLTRLIETTDPVVASRGWFGEAYELNQAADYIESLEKRIPEDVAAASFWVRLRWAWDVIRGRALVVGASPKGDNHEH